MGLLRDWYRDNCADRKKRVKMLLADGEYHSAAMDFRGLDMHHSAADAFMKAGDARATEGDVQGAVYAYNDGIESYEKAGEYENMRRACAKAWRFKPDYWRSDEHIEQLIASRQFETFLESVKEYNPERLASCLERIEQPQVACELYAFAAEQGGNAKERCQNFHKAIECGLKANVDKHKLLRLHEEDFKAEIAMAKGWLDLTFQTQLGWVAESGYLSEFIDDMVDEYPACLWFVIWEGIDHIDKRVREANQQLIAGGLLRCVNRAEEMSSLEKGWEFIGQADNYYSYTASRLEGAGMFSEAATMYAASATMRGWGSDQEKAGNCWDKANQPGEAARAFEQAGKFERAAELAASAGDDQWAVSLYERALQAGHISSADAERMKTHIASLRPGGEKLSPD